ncbi:hypothetical protein M979_0329 [Buttiauxella noackiae ATCC 51607]|uniref:Uncharacterized protein n=1 Tax=Buttiauxella noackiae ATCC 51607 TaxID=1354255 RepID=A0A1B7HZH1_9ENTR|nr:hypothetical protein [Buttiauxella noackiae]OAT21100.1 hypothetical protein M979_0329 [Buttiauxella noackiae ATCC 51607]
MKQLDFTVEELKTVIMELLRELKNEDPQHLTRTMFAKHLLGERVTEKVLHDAVKSLHREGCIVLADSIMTAKPGYPYPLIESTFHLPS